jgi:hypothetical protein
MLRCFGGNLVTSRPPMRIDPASALSSPAMSRSVAEQHVERAFDEIERHVVDGVHDAALRRPVLAHASQFDR